MHVLVVDDDPHFNKMLTTFLSRKDYRVSSVHSSNSALEALNNNQDIDIVLTDFRLPDMDGLALIERIKRKNSSLPVILITNYSDLRTAVRSIKLGAYEFVTKPVIPDELLITMERALKSAQSIEDPKPSGVVNLDTQGYIIGTNSGAKKVWEHILTVAPTKMSVLIIGESGTGKEHVARMLHNKSKRASQPFVAIDCGALSKELAASELFGHQKGAFTGAVTDKKGVFELAEKGTLFLDEVGNLPYDVQVKLLRAIQERQIRRVGSEKDLSVDVRIVAATNEQMKEALESNSFRNDLYHRLNEFVIKLPPLRERIDDLEEYIHFFLQQASEELDKEVKTVTPEALEILRNYSWPGNLRELKNIIKRGVLLTRTNEISTAQLPDELMEERNVVDQHIKEHKADVPSTNLKQLKENQEKEMIIKVLQNTKFNKSKTASLLNIDRKTLYAKIKQYDIDA